MAIHPPGPYLLRIPYVVDNLSHVLEINCDVIGTPAIGSAPADVEMETRGATSPTLTTAVGALWTVVRPLLSNLTLASAYSLVKCRPENNDVVFISGGPLSPIGGSTVAPYVPASQMTLTYYSALGNLAKFVLLEGVSAGNTRVPVGSAQNADIVTLNAYILSDANIIMARDRSFPVAGINSSLGQNEKVFSRRFRS